MLHLLLILRGIYLIFFKCPIIFHLLKDDVNFVEAWGLPIFFFLVLIVFDYFASKRYGNFSDEIMDQWKEDKIQFMKMFTEDVRKKYDANNDGKISEDELEDGNDKD